MTPWTVAHQTPLSVEFFRWAYWLWVAISFFRGSCWPRDRTCVSCIGRRILYHCVTREAQSKYTPIKSNCKKKCCITKQISNYIYILIFKNKVIFMNLWVNSFTVFLTSFIIQCLSPVQVWCTILDAWGWCTGTTQREGMGREEGGGFRMGSTGIPVADSFRHLAKLIQYCKT